MIEPSPRLIQCFAAVFPKLSREQILNSDIESIPEWDSLATVTLASILDQEFGTAIDVFDLPELRSFPAVQDYLRRRNLLS
jgi:acyl carrier protein